MTDRTISLVVALQQEIRKDDIEPLINAIKMIKFVSEVKINIFTGADQMNAWAAKQHFLNELSKEVMNAILNEKK